MVAALLTPRVRNQRKRQLSLLLSFLPEKKEEELLVKNVSGLRYGLIVVFYPFTPTGFGALLGISVATILSPLRG